MSGVDAFTFEVNLFPRFLVLFHYFNFSIYSSHVSFGSSYSGSSYLCLQANTTKSMYGQEKNTSDLGYSG